MFDLKIYFFIFILYSFIGWCLEVIWTLVCDKKLVNRGFLIGPYCPIYGVGCLLLVFLLDDYKNNIILLFFVSIVVCSLLEYFTSYFMEKIFNARWWDYSNYKFNLNGRICLETMIPFGLLGVLVIRLLNPFLMECACVSNFIFLLVLIVFFFDVGLSFGIVANMKNMITKVALDNTEEITKIVKDFLFSKSFFNKRLVDAFPTFKASLDRLKKIINK